MWIEADSCQEAPPVKWAISRAPCRRPRTFPNGIPEAIFETNWRPIWLTRIQFQAKMA